MKDKISKLISVIKKYGILKTAKKGIYYLQANVWESIPFFSMLRLAKKKNECKIRLETILVGCKYERIIIFRSNFGWNVPLFQRPQHMMRQFARQNCLVFYEVTNFTDQCEMIRQQEKNLYLVNFNHSAFSKLFHDRIDELDVPKYVDIYSTDWRMKRKEMERYVEKDYQIIYEYIDELSPQLSGTKKIPENVKSKYEYAMSEIGAVAVVVTADVLYQDVLFKRGKKNVIYAANGVDYQHFALSEARQGTIDLTMKEEFLKILSLDKPIIGYYGAIASWFDYELIRKLAMERPDIEIVLIGIFYDTTYKKEGLSKFLNIHFLGAVEYEKLPLYASQMDVLTIPFVINDITRATSPLKVYEYMALHKPIVTTDMPECRKYKSVLAAADHNEFIEFVDKAIKMKDDSEYLELLDQEARKNTWEQRARKVLEGIDAIWN